MKSASAFGLVCMAALLSGCGAGSGGGVNTVSPPPPTPTPSPAPSNNTLVNLTASQQFANDAVTSTVGLDGNNLTVAASQSSTSLTVSYDASTRSYTIAASGRTETFSPSNLIAAANPGQIDYRKDQGLISQFLTLTEPGSPQNRSIQYVGGGYWQRNDRTSGSLQISFDAFSYGLQTTASAVPRTGTAGYAVDLFGFFAPRDRTPKAVVGEGTFTADLRNGQFATAGTAYEVDLTDPYYTGQHAWRGAGTISSSTNGFAGGFAYDGRDRFSVSGQVEGRFYGPQAQELGAVFHAQDAEGTLLTGTLLGKQSSSVTGPALTVLDSDQARSFYTSQHAVQYLQYPGSTRLEGAASVPIDGGGRLEFAADDSVQLVAKPSSNELPRPVFSAADRLQAESNSRYSTYRSSSGGDEYRLELYNPGPGNDELALTYTSFGRWDRVTRTPAREETANVWFAYGVPTETGVLARTGSASYSMALHGSGVTFADGAQYKLSGTALMNVNFNTMAYSGSLDALATAVTGGAMIDFAPLPFGGEMYNSYGFQSYLSSRPGFADGQITGRLYGPRGDEVGATFDIMPRDAAGFATGHFAGAAVGKRD